MRLFFYNVNRDCIGALSNNSLLVGEKTHIAVYGAIIAPVGESPFVAIDEELLIGPSAAEAIPFITTSNVVSDTGEWLIEGRFATETGYEH